MNVFISFYQWGCPGFGHRLYTSLLFLLAMTSFANSISADPAPDRARQQQYLEDSLSINMEGRGRYPMTTLKDKTWRDWQERTGELPPDFELMSSNPFLPDPLSVSESAISTGTITTPEQWDKKKDWIRKEFQYWISGNVPPPPGNVEAKILEDRMDGRSRVQLIELHFGPDHKAKMTFELIVPEGPGPKPVYMTQWNHRDWAQLAVRRGYIGCVYAGADSNDDTDAYQALYPEYDFSQLMRRAWGASRIVDYLLTRPEVNKDQIAITGHSRNGKQSLWATAFDERIGAVVTSSGGTGDVMPWRYSDPQYTDETIDGICGIANVWFQPRLRFFFGREDKLPIDQNLLMALVAPRPLLMTFSHMEHQSNLWAAEKCYASVKTVYDFLGHPDNISMFVRKGEHAVAARDVERHIDFLDNQFGRRSIPWDMSLVFDYDFDKWKAKHSTDETSAGLHQPVILKEKYSSKEAFEKDQVRFRDELSWLLGETPPGVSPLGVAPTVASRIDWMDQVTGRPIPAKTKQIHIGPYTALGDHMAATIYIPTNTDGTTHSLTGDKLPLVIYLHQYSYAHGYAFGYNPRGGSGGARNVIQRLTNQGFAVMAIDMFGFGTRMMEARYFYDRFAEWSKLGKMVSDVSACVDAAESFDFVDKDSIFVLGDTIGGATGLMAAALDERIDGVAVVAAFSPWRASNARYESIRVFSHMHGFLPRLGFYAKEPTNAPVDYPEILAAIAPRPLMVIAPLLDRHSDPAATGKALEDVGKVYDLLDKADNFRVENPREINRLMPEMEDQMITFFKDHVTSSSQPVTAGNH